MTLLITGFRRSDGEPNASALLIESLRRDLPPSLGGCAHRLRFHLLDYDETDARSEAEGLERQLAAALRDFSPEICLFTGQAPGRNRISVERLALNLFGDEIIEPGGPVGCWSTLPGLTDLPGLLQAAGIPAELSGHAGTYLCNHLLYSALRRAEDCRGVPRAGFVHLPVNPCQLGTYRDAPFMPLAMARDAIALIVGHLVNLEEHR